MGILKLELLKKTNLKLLSSNFSNKERKIKSLDELYKKYDEDRVYEVHQMYLLNSKLSEGYNQGHYSLETEVEAITKTSRFFDLYGKKL